MPAENGNGRSATLRVLGIDPGTAATGYGLVAREGNRFTCIEYGVWRTRAGDPLPRRLVAIADALDALLDRVRPDAVALEQAFFGKNVQSALRLGETRGALLYAFERRGFEVAEYPTASVKKALAGNGRADKSQVQFMVQKLLGMSVPPKPLDASDALALAFTLASDRTRCLAARRPPAQAHPLSADIGIRLAP